MRRIKGHIYLGLLLCCAFFLSALSATAGQPYQPSPPPARLGELWRWHHVAELDLEGVRCMAAAQDGAMWFGVNNGVLRYDGVQWERHNKANGFVDTSVDHLAVATDGTLYAISRDILFQYDDVKWKRIFPPRGKNLNLTCLNASKNGGVWLGSTSGLFHIEGNNTRSITESRYAATVKDIFSDRAVIEIMPDVRGQDRSKIAGIFEDEAGMVTIAYNSGWFVQIDSQRRADAPGASRALRVPTDFVDKRTINMAGSEDGRIWVGFGASAYSIDFAMGQYTLLPLSEKHPNEQSIHTLVRTADGELLIASSSYLFCKSGDQWKSFSYPRPDMSNYPLMMLDGNQNLWVGKLHGRVYRVDLSSKRWETLSDLIFQGEDSSGAHWFLGVEGHVIRRHEGKWMRYDQQDGLMAAPVALLCSRGGPIWVLGSEGQNAASAYRDEQGRWHKTLHPQLPRLISPASLFEDSGGSIWFGGYGSFPLKGRGVVEAEPDGHGGYRFTHHPSPDRVACIAELPDQTMVFGAFALWEARNSQLSRIINKDAKPVEKYYALDCGQDGSLWLAAEGHGVQNYRQGTWSAYTRQDGLSDNRIKALYCSDVDKVWALGAKGLSYFDGRAWTPNVYGELFPGLANLSGFIRESGKGSLWLNYVSPQWLGRRGAQYKPESNIIFKTIRCRSVSLPPETEIIDSMERVALPGSMTVRWKGASPWKQTVDDALYYSWRLNQGEWSPYSLNRDVTLRSLNPGRHTFEVRARDYDLNVDPSPAMISFIAVAPVWQQAWFILLIVLFIAFVLLAIWQWFRIHEVRAVAAEKYATDMERMKLRFFTNISHELRTPLTVLLGTLKSAKTGPRRALGESLDMALRNARKLHDLVNEMLDMRKLEQGEWKLEPKYGDVASFILEITESLKSLAGEKNIKINMLNNGSASAWFDPGKLHKIVTNLISNAIKYGVQNGRVDVRIRLDEPGSDTFPEGGTLFFEIEDDGVGIATEELPYVFDRFYQGTGGSAEKPSSGIGLSFTKELVTLWGGSIEVTSPIKDGLGTRFTVRLPVSLNLGDEADGESEDEPDIAAADQAIPDGHAVDVSDDEKEKILVVDDDADMRRFIRHELNDQYELFEAADGEEGLGKALEIIPDLILCDVMMPRVGGLEMCERLKQEALTQTVPIILLTGRTSEGGELEGLKTGVDDYLAKPFEIARLQASIRNLLRSRRELRERYSREIAEAPKADSEATMEDPFLQRAREIVESHLADFEFDLNVLAEKMSVSSSSLWRKFKQAAGKTPATFIRELRLRQAFLLLQQKNSLIEEVVGQVGFLDTSYFRTCFKKQYGITPVQCRDGVESFAGAQDLPADAGKDAETSARTVLVVEDDADLRRYVCNELRAKDYGVLEAENGVEGWNVATEFLPDIIITDLMMPILNGIELCKKIKTHEATNHIPIVMLSARTDENIQIKGLDIGADSYITKPFDMEILATRLENLLENRRKMAARYRRQITEASENDGQNMMDDSFLQRTVACIEENLENPAFSVEMMAEMLSITTRTLQRKIAALSELSPGELIKTMRMKKAEHLLRTTDMPIGEIAYACGFGDRKYFSVQFKKCYGMSPSQVRKT